MPKGGNPCNKMRDKNNPYEIWEVNTGAYGLMTYRVLKKWQHEKNEANNPYARWFCAVKSDGTHGSCDLGDCYVRDIKMYGKKIKFNKEELEEW